MREIYKVESHFGAIGWSAVQWQNYRKRIGCISLPCDHIICDMYKNIELSQIKKRKKK